MLERRIQGKESANCSSVFATVLVYSDFGEKQMENRFRSSCSESDLQFRPPSRNYRRSQRREGTAVS